MQDLYLESRGIAYRTNGMDTGKETILFIHGISGSCSNWVEFEEALENRYNIVEFDLRGHGLSLRPRTYSGYEIGEFVADIRELARHLKIETCAVVAHSFGTLIARELIIAEPALVSKALLLAAPYKLMDTWHGAAVMPTELARRVCDCWPLPMPAHGRMDYAKLHHSPDFDLHRIVPEIYRMGVRS